MADLDSVSRRVMRGEPIEEVLGKFDWRDFERTVGDIFRQNDFRVMNNFRFRTSRRWEVDLVASRGSAVFCVDCKRWSRGREKSWSLRRAAREQAARTRALSKFLGSNPTARARLGAGGNLVPVVATLFEENVLREGPTFVVPVKKLNSFIAESDSLL